MNTPFTWQEAFGGLSGLREALQRSAWIISFNKVNGERRDMTCTLNAQYINRHEVPKPVTPEKFNNKANEDPFYEQEQRDRKAKLAETNLAVFDIEKNAWRSMKIENIIKVTPAGINVSI